MPDRTLRLTETDLFHVIRLSALLDQTPTIHPEESALYWGDPLTPCRQTAEVIASAAILGATRACYGFCYQPEAYMRLRPLNVHEEATPV